ncbi:helix-turn-helix transcriptional regulator [Flavobacterium sp. UMI-01]|uniref:helix-turn-helix domain-containing protein n=1 Tax=Flavobacterium sp. UMI-01 TaxID=1441053 RepID=UPI001C7D8F13|nr:helix-turn-helix transcriptional regulator [Flavobacterium sp. UMI-01]GIZ08307.1 transcriptional regulator [Flavobacterium sp. UMI-01]
MVNTTDFIKRLELILDYYGLNASAFADKIGVQRSSLSHLLSGRNKPSLDFILKILDEFPEIDLYWILNGKGQFPKETDEAIPQKSTEHPPAIPEVSQDLFSSQSSATPLPKSTQSNATKEVSMQQTIEAEIEKIVVFYKNGTFKTYSPE